MHFSKCFSTALILYLCIVAWIVLLSREPSEKAVIKPCSETILVILGNYPDLQSDKTALHPEALFTGDILNIFLFMPIGLFSEGILISKKKNSLLWTAILGLSFSFLIEVLQLLTRRGWFDADDLLMNMIGSIAGGGLFLFFKWVFKICSLNWRDTNAR